MKFLVVLSFIVGSQAQIFSTGRCPDVKLQKNFDMKAFSGTWNEIYRYENIPQLNHDCGRMIFINKDQGYDVKTVAVKQGVYNARLGSAVQDPESNGEGRLLIEFPIYNTDEVVNVKYNILETDYVSYAVIQSCEDVFSNHKAVYSWILSRKDALGPVEMMGINRVIASNPTLSWGGYRKTDQSVVACAIID